MQTSPSFYASLPGSAIDERSMAVAAIFPVSDVTISDCDFGTPANLAQPDYLYNVKGLALSQVTIGGKVHNATLSA